MIDLIVYLAVTGFLVWLIVSFIPMPEPFKRIIIGVVCFVLVIWVLRSFGVLHGYDRIRLH